MTCEEALEAIVARYNGEWDNPSLMLFGPLSINTEEDMYYIAKYALNECLQPEPRSNYER